MQRKALTSLVLLILIWWSTLSNSFFAFALTPNDIANRVFHYDAQDLDADGNPANQPANNTSVTELIDLANTFTGTQTTPSKQALYQTNAINTKPALFFDGIDDLYNIPDSLLLGSDNTYPEKSFAVVFKTSDDILSLQTIYEQWGKEKWYGLQIENGNLYAGAWNTLDWPAGEEYKIADLGAIQTDTTYNIMLNQESTTSKTLKVYVNGILVKNILNVNIQTTNGQCMISWAFSCYLFTDGGSTGIGSTKNDTLQLSNLTGTTGLELNPFKGHIWELMSWNKALTPSDVQGLFAYFDDRWRLQAPTITINNPFVTWVIQPGNFDIQVSYNDFNSGNGIDLTTDIVELYKWNGSVWGPDISGSLVNLAGKTMDNFQATYPVTGITSGKYRLVYNISKTNTLQGSAQRDFYVGELLPSDIPGTVFHYDAQDINGDGNLGNNPANGSAIQTLTDKFNGYDATQATAGNRPTLQNNSINSYPSILFDGTNDYYDVANQSAINTAGTYTQKTFAAVFKTGTDVNTFQNIYEQGGWVRWYSFVVENGHVYAGVWNNNEWDAGHQYKSVDLGIAQPNTVYFAMIVQDSQSANDNLNTLKIYLNGNLASQQDHTDSQSAHGGAIGIWRVDGNTRSPRTNATVNTWNYFAWNLWELISWNHALDQAEVNGVQEYFSQRWWVVLFSEVTPVADPTSEATPSYTFSTNTTGTLSYGGSCNSTTTSAVLGNNTIQFDSNGAGWALSNGTYSDCTITLTDGSGFPHVLNVTPFTVDVATLTLTETNPVPTPGSNHLPSYTFNSPIAGTIEYNGACSSNSTTASIGDNTIILNYLADGTYSDCYLRVNDGSTPTAFLQLTAFTIISSSPTIGSWSINENMIFPLGNFNFSFDYTDTTSINTGSANLVLQKYNSGTSNYDADISGTNTTQNSVTSTLASYSANNLTFWKYRATFDISNTAGWNSQKIIIFYVDAVEFTIDTPTADIGNLQIGSIQESQEVTVTVRTIGAWFRVNMNQTWDMAYTTNTIEKFDGTEGFGYRPTPYTGVINAINNASLANQNKLLNTNGEKNTYVYRIKLATLLQNIEQSAWDYETDLDFGIVLDY